MTTEIRQNTLNTLQIYHTITCTMTSVSTVISVYMMFRSALNVHLTFSVIIHTDMMVLLPDRLVMVHLGCSYNIVNMNHKGFY